MGLMQHIRSVLELINTVVVPVMCLKLLRVHVGLVLVLLIKFEVQIASKLWIKFNVQRRVRRWVDGLVWVVEIAQRSWEEKWQKNVGKMSRNKNTVTVNRW